LRSEEKIGCTWEAKRPDPRSLLCSAKIAALFSIVESYRKLGVPIRQYLTHVLPGLANRSIQSLGELTPAAYAAKMAK
jgi:hypothetical protein